MLPSLVVEEVRHGVAETLLAQFVPSTDLFTVPWCDRQPAGHVAAETLQSALERVHAIDTVDGTTAAIKDTLAPWAAGPTALPPDMDIEPHTPATRNRSNRMKYRCLPCRINVWGKPGLQLVCGVCGSPFSESEP